MIKKYFLLFLYPHIDKTMVQYFPYLLLLMVAIMLLIMLANRLKVAYPILLVLGGLAISFIPNVPTITLNPDLVLIIFLPPLLYADVFSLSLKEMWKWRRIIFSFAFIVVFITAAAVAWVANRFFIGFRIPFRGSDRLYRCGECFNDNEVCKGTQTHFNHHRKREFAKRCFFTNSF